MQNLVENRKPGSGFTLSSLILTLPFLLLITVLQSCKDEVAEVEKKITTYPVVYTSIPVNDYTIRAYTRDGEITDSATMNSISRRFGLVLTRDNNYNSDGELVITYLSSKKVEVRTLNSSVVDTLAVNINEDHIFFEKKDIVTFPLGSGFEVYYFKNLFRYKPLYYKEIPVPLSSGYSKAGSYKPGIFVKPTGEYLILPMMNLIDRSPYSYKYLPQLNNEICTDSLHTLYSIDTLIVNEFTIKLKKKN